MNKSITVDRELSHSTYKGLNTTQLIEKITRERIFDSLYWKQYCFNINAASLLDRAVEIGCIGNIPTSGSPFPFICLFVKLIQLMPSREIIEFYATQDRFKYLKVLGLLFVRLVYRDYLWLRRELTKNEDYRKVRIFENDGYKLSYIDEVVDRLIEDERFIGLTLPYMKKEEDESSDSDSDESSDSD